MFSIIITAILIIVFVTFILWLLNRGGEHVNEYFYKAVQVWLLQNDENARIAALAAVKTASPHAQRDCVGKLRVIHFELSAQKHPDKLKKARLLKDFIDEIKTKVWTVEEATKERETLYKAEPEYASALNKYDSTVFIRRYPEMKNKTNEQSELKPCEELLVALTT